MKLEEFVRRGQAAQRSVDEQLQAAARGPMRAFVRWRARGEPAKYGAPRWSSWHVVRAVDGRTTCGMKLPQLAESECVQVPAGGRPPPKQGARFCSLCQTAQASTPSARQTVLDLPLPWGRR